MYSNILNQNLILFVIITRDYRETSHNHKSTGRSILFTCYGYVSNKFLLPRFSSFYLTPHNSDIIFLILFHYCVPGIAIFYEKSCFMA